MSKVNKFQFVVVAFFCAYTIYPSFVMGEGESEVVNKNFAFYQVDADIKNIGFLIDSEKLSFNGKAEYKFIADESLRWFKKIDPKLKFFILGRVELYSTKEKIRCFLIYLSQYERGQVRQIYLKINSVIKLGRGNVAKQKFGFLSPKTGKLVNSWTVDQYLKNVIGS